MGHVSVWIKNRDQEKVICMEMELLILRCIMKFETEVSESYIKKELGRCAGEIDCGQNN